MSPQFPAFPDAMVQLDTSITVKMVNTHISEILKAAPFQHGGPRYEEKYKAKVIEYLELYPE